MGEREEAVHRDGVVQRREEGPPVLDHAEHAVAQALVVVDDVELVAPLGEQLARALREGQRLPEAGGAHDGELGPVLARRELAAVRDPKGVGVPVEVQARHRGEADPRIELGPGRAREDLDRVPEGDQLAGEVAGVDALATAARVPPIGQVRHA